jgi:ribosomal protein S18 acetylase RimI-like enzyme
MRHATPLDGAALAELVNFAGEGLPHHFWRSIAGPGEDPWAVGAARQAQQAESGNVVVVEEGLRVVAAMMGYPLRSALPAPPADLPAVAEPLVALERRVPDTWYLNVLAAFPQARGRGIGSRLVRLAEESAAAEDLKGVSIIVADGNLGALRLYERLGYVEIDRAPMVKDGWESQSEAWILLLKEIGS